MKSDPVQLDFWKTASTGAEQVESKSFVWPANESISSATSFQDRLLNLCLNGFFPSLALCLLGFLISGGTSSLGTSVGALVLVPIFAGFFLPFLRRCGIVSGWRIALLSLPVLLACVFGTLLPAAVEQRLEGNFLHLEFFAVLLQQGLEQALSLESFGLYLAGVVLLVLATVFLSRRCPWYEPAASSKLSVIWRLALLGAIVVPLLVEVAGVAFVSEEHDNWVREKKSEFENRPYFQLPETSDSDFWEKEFTQFRTLVDGINVGNSPDFKLSPEHLDRIVSEIGLSKLKEHEPRSKEDLKNANSYFIWHLSCGAFPSPSPLMSLMKLHFFKRPTGDSIYTEDKLPKLLTALASHEADEQQLRAWLGDINELQKLLFTREQELDMEAARVLWGDGLNVAEQLGWYSPEEVYSWQPEKKMGWQYRAVTTPQDLKIFGLSFSHSPTRWMYDYQMRRLTRAWVSLRQSLATQDLEQQLRVLGTLRDSLNAPGTTEYQFWDALYRENNVSNERALLTTAEVIVAVRLYYQESGAWPQALPELGLDIDPARFEWTTKGAEATLRDLPSEQGFSWGRN